MAAGNGGTDFEGFHPITDSGIVQITDLPSEGYSQEITKVLLYRKAEPAPIKKPLDGAGNRLRITQEIDSALKAINNAKESDDPMERAIQASYLEDSLDVLWDLRGPREAEFTELVNLIDLQLKHITPEVISNEQLEAFYKILDRILRRTLHKEDFEEALDILEESGINPWSLLASDE